MLLFGEPGNDDVTMTSTRARCVESVDDVDVTSDFTVSVRYASILAHSAVVGVFDDDDFRRLTIDLDDVTLAVRLYRT